MALPEGVVELQEVVLLEELDDEEPLELVLPDAFAVGLAFTAETGSVRPMAESEK